MIYGDFLGEGEGEGGGVKGKRRLDNVPSGTACLAVLCACACVSQAYAMCVVERRTIFAQSRVGC